MFRVKLRVIARSPEEAERAREYLLTKLPGLTLAAARKGNNPKYANQASLPVYGDLDVPEKVRGASGRLKVEPERGRKRHQKAPVKVRPAKSEADALDETRKRLEKTARGEK